MKNDNIKENEISDKEESLVETSNEKLNEEMDSDKQELVSNESDISIEENSENQDQKKGNTCIKEIFANLLDQALIMACSGLLLLLFDFIIRRFGYMVAIPEQVLIIIYFIVNCIYSPIIKRTKLKNTIARKILNLN